MGVLVPVVHEAAVVPVLVGVVVRVIVVVLPTLLERPVGIRSGGGGVYGGFPPTSSPHPRTLRICCSHKLRGRPGRGPRGRQHADRIGGGCCELQPDGGVVVEFAKPRSSFHAADGSGLKENAKCF